MTSQNLLESGVSISSINVISLFINPNSNLVSAIIIFFVRAYSLAILYKFKEISFNFSDKSAPTKSHICSNVIFSSCPTSAFVEGVNIGSFSFELSTNPDGSFIPQTV